MKILSVNVVDKPGRIKSDLRNEKLPYPVLIGRKTGISRKYKLRSLPFLYIVDKKGFINTSEKFVKYKDLQEKLDLLLPEK